MTISSTSRVSSLYTGNGVTTSFAFGFKVQDSDDIAVYRLASAAEELVSDSEYTVSLNANQNTHPGGSVVFTTAPTSAHRLKITTDADATQELDIQNQGAFNPAVVMEALDKLTIQTQQLREKLLRGLHMPITDGLSGLLDTAEERAGKVLAFDDVTGAPVAATLASLNVDVALGTLWAGALAQNLSDNIPVSPTVYGYRVGGGTADAANNTTALQTALDNHYRVMLPAGTAYVNKITHTRANVLMGVSQGASVLMRADNLNDYVLYASAKNDLRYENFTLDQNRANNTGSGSHTGIRLEGGCSRWTLEGVKVTGARGTFSGSPVGAGFSSVGGGSHGVLKFCWFDDCYDGYVLSAHTDARDYGSRMTSCLRNGGLVSGGSHRFENHGVNATGNSTTYAGAGMQINASDDCKGYGGTFNSNTLGHGYQHNTAARCELHGGTYSSNGISGADYYASVDGKVYGGYAASNAIRGLEVDSASNGFAGYGFQGASNGDVDISVFRSADVRLFGCKGNVRGWDSGSIASATVSAGGTGYTVGDVLTIVGGTKLTAATLTVATLSGSAVATVTVSNAGNYWTFPSEPAAVTGGTGSGATFNFVGVGEASSTVARLQITGGHRGDTITLIPGACVDVRLTDVAASTITDNGVSVVASRGCDNFPDVLVLAEVPSYADQAAAAAGITGVGRLWRQDATGLLGITLT